MVAPWKPRVKRPSDELPPGRIARVYTTHKRTLQILLKKSFRKKIRLGLH